MSSGAPFPRAWVGKAHRTGAAVARRDWRHDRERQRSRGRGRREPPKSARDAVEALLREELGGRGFRAALEAEAARGGRARPSAQTGRRRDLTDAADLHRRPGDRARLRRRGLGPARGRRRRGSGSTSPTSPPTCRPARRSTWRRAAAPTAPTSPGAVEPMLPHALSERRLQPRARGRAAGGDGRDRARARRRARRAPRFYRSRIRSDARLDYDELDAIFSGRAEAAGRRSPSRSAVAREVAAALGERRGATSLDVESFEPEFRFDRRRQRRSAPTASPRPSPTG